MNKIKDWVVGLLVKKYALGWLVKSYRAASGWRTGIAIGLSLIVFAAQAFGYIPESLANEIYKVLGSAGAVTFLEKLRKYQKVAEKAAGAIKEEAAKAPVIDDLGTKAEIPSDPK
jgi:hypothetical protein